MLNTLKNRYEQGCRTSTYPKTTIRCPRITAGCPWFLKMPQMK
jgi:hypothetical protein